MIFWQIQSYHALSQQFQGFCWVLGGYSLGGIEGLERGTKEQEVAHEQMVSQHNSNWNQSHYSRLYWLNWICHEKSQVFLLNHYQDLQMQIGKTQFFLRHPVSCL